MTKKEELLLSKTSAEDCQDKQNSGSEEDNQLVDYKQINDTPFTAVRNGKKWKLVLGQSVMSEREWESYESVKRYVASKPWKLIMLATALYANEMQEVIKRYKKEKNG